MRIVVYLTAAVVAVGLVCLLDLVLSVGVIRRLRVHADHLNRLLQVGGPAGGVPVGETVGAFTATTIDGEAVSRELLAGQTLVGFFSPGCQPCAAQLPRFVDYARASSRRPGRVLAVVDTDGEDGKDYVERLSRVGPVVVEGHDGPLQAAFRVTSFPMLYLVGDGGVVVASGVAMDNLEQLAASRVATPDTATA
jgi:hypothetical protein